MTEGRRVRDRVVDRAVLDGAGHACAALEDGLRDHRRREVVVRRVVELDEDRQELRLLHALCLLDLTRALVLLDRLGLELGQLSCSLGVARSELAVEGRGLIEGGLVGRSVDAVLALDFLPCRRSFDLRGDVVDVFVIRGAGSGRRTVARADQSLADEQRRSQKGEDDQGRKQPPSGRMRRGSHDQHSSKGWSRVAENGSSGVRGLASAAVLRRSARTVTGRRRAAPLGSGVRASSMSKGDGTPSAFHGST